MMEQPDTAAPTILREHRGNVLWLTLNRAAKANSLTVAMSESLAAAIRQAAGDGRTSAIVITGTGPRTFCAGVDLREQPADGDMAAQRARRSAATARFQDLIIATRLPVIVALNGLAVGAGAMLALVADRCVAADHAALSLPEIDIGIPTFSGASILEARAGAALARDLIQTGRKLPAAEAQARGLLTVVPSERLLEAAQAQAEELGGKHAETFGAVKRWLNRGLTAAIQDARNEHAAHRERAAAKEEGAHG